MKLNKCIMLLFALGILMSGFIISSYAKIKESNPDKKRLRNLAKLIAANVIHKLERNIKFEEEVSKEVEQKNLIPAVKILSYRLVNGVNTRVEQGKIINMKQDLTKLQNQAIEQVERNMRRRLSPRRIEKCVMRVEKKNGALDDQTRTRIIYAIKEAFEQLTTDSPANLFRRPNSNRVLSKTKRYFLISQSTKVSIQVKKSLNKVSALKNAKKNVKKIIQKAIPKNVQKVLKRIDARLNAAEALKKKIQNKITDNRTSPKQVRKLVKALRHVKKIQKILEIKKNSKISAVVTKKTKQTMNKIMNIKNQIRNTNHPAQKAALKRQLKSEIKKIKGLIKVNNKLRKAISKGKKEEKKLEAKLKSTQHIQLPSNAPIVHHSSKKIDLSKSVAPIKKVFKLNKTIKRLVNRIQKKLIQAGCKNTKQIKRLIREIKRKTAKIGKNIKVAVKNAKNVKTISKSKSVVLKKVQKAIPSFVTSRNASKIADKIQKNISNVKNIPAHKVEKVSEEISKKILKNAINSKAVKIITRSLIKKVLNSKTSVAGKKIMIKIINKIIEKNKKNGIQTKGGKKIQNKIPQIINSAKASIVASKLHKAISNNKITSVKDIKKISDAVSKKIVQNATSIHAARKGLLL